VSQEQRSYSGHGHIVGAGVATTEGTASGCLSLTPATVVAAVCCSDGCCGDGASAALTPAAMAATSCCGGGFYGGK
jgi:hypothetical protein